MPNVEINHRKLYYEDIGEGFPVVFGHSYLWDASMWAPQVEALAGSYRCILPELWMHGSSDFLPHDAPVYSLDELTRDYEAFVNALGLEQFAVVGLSVGGMWGIRLALSIPERVTGLVLAGTDVGEEPHASKQKFFQMMDAVSRAGCLPPPIIEAMLPLFFSDQTLATRPDLVEGFRTAMAAVPPARLSGILAIGRGIFGRPHLARRIEEVRCPTLVIVGEQDRSRPPPEAQRMAHHIPNAELHILPDTGHICNLEAPEQFTALLEEFLETLPQNRT